MKKVYDHLKSLLLRFWNFVVNFFWGGQEFSSEILPEELSNRLQQAVQSNKPCYMVQYSYDDGKNWTTITDEVHDDLVIIKRKYKRAGVFIYRAISLEGNEIIEL